MTPERKQTLTTRAMAMAEQIRNQRAEPGDEPGLRRFVMIGSVGMITPLSDDEVTYICNKIRFYFDNWLNPPRRM